VTQSNKSLFVTRPALPPLEEFLPMIEDIWASRVLTNSGPYHQRYLGVEHVSLVANATLGLMLAIRQLNLVGEVITSPFSFIATGSALLWGGLTPVFVDIHKDTLNIDPEQIECAITPRTTAIMGVHCYGRPCDVGAIEAIAKRHDLRVIYDAAHAFGIRHEGKSVLRYGDLSVLSFHATKVFNTFEGGAIISRTAEEKLQIDRLINYGIADELTVESVGFNAKMSEFTAALGLLQLKHIDSYINDRKRVDCRYRKLLRSIPGLEFALLDGAQPENFYSFPVLIGKEYPHSRDELYWKLRASNIFARRYFFPLLSDLPIYEKFSQERMSNLIVAQSVASRILCLPMYPDLSSKEQHRIAAIMHGN
jgi:dTDP-4-amino-4,6-dideoxygalactose transaminase